MSGANNFDFLVGDWSVLNKRKKGESFWADQESEAEAIWEEFPADNLIEKRLDGRAVVEHWEATLPSGERVKALSVKAVDPATQLWSIMWIDTRNGPDFRPVVGKFQEGIFTGEQIFEAPDGRHTHLRLVWDQITEDTARWWQAFSYDEGVTWNTNWLMYFTRRK